LEAADRAGGWRVTGGGSGRLVRRAPGHGQRGGERSGPDMQQSCGYFTSSRAFTIPSTTVASTFAAPGLPPREA
jgi:hypothetical protein